MTLSLNLAVSRVCLILLCVLCRTFAPMWDVFRVSSDKLALCHLELMRKMNDLIRDINKYGEEQVKIHRKVKYLGSFTTVLTEN